VSFISTNRIALILDRTDSVKFHTHLEDQIPFDLKLHNGLVIDTCVENFSGAVLKALAASTPKCRPRGDLRLSIPARNPDPALKPKVKCLQRSVTRRLKEWRNDQWSATLKSIDPEDHSRWRMTKRLMRVPTSSPPGHPAGFGSLRLRNPKLLLTL
jgi:hypothetical protein